MQLINEEILENSVKRLTFNVTGSVSKTHQKGPILYCLFTLGPSHRNLFIYPLDENQLINWNLMDEVPKATANYKQRHAYFIFTGYGKINEPLEFFIDIQV